MRNVWISTLLLFLLLTGCQTTETDLPPEPTRPIPTHVWLGVVEDARPLGELLAQQFAADGIVLHIVFGNPADLEADLTAGNLDGVIAYRVPPSAGWFNPVAVDGLVAVVDPAQPISALDRAQLQQLLTGRLTSWEALGGPAQPVQLVVRERGSSGRRLLAELLLDGQPLPVNARTATTEAAVLEMVVGDSSTLGMIWYGTLGGSVRPLVIDGVQPNPGTLARQDYPFTAPIYFYGDGEPQGALRTVVGWIQGETGQTLIGSRYGRVDEQP